MSRSDLEYTDKLLLAINNQWGPLSLLNLISKYAVVFPEDFPGIEELKHSISNLQCKGYLKLDFSSGRYYNTTPPPAKEFTGSVEFTID